MNQEQALWYLGLDFGTTGISVVLLNEQTRCFYPLQWLENDRRTSVRTRQVRFSPQIEGLEEMGLRLPAIDRLKPWLDISLPSIGEPSLQWSNRQTLSYQRLIEAIAQKLQDLSVVEKSFSAESKPYWVVSAASSLEQVQPLTPDRLIEIFSQLSGVIVGCPHHWSDAYRFNLREAILKAGWVNEGQKIVFLQEAIALVLSEMRDTGQGNQWQGPTLILDSGATTTEFALVDIPLQRSQLSYGDFHLGSVHYGGDAIDQDIICQLLLNLENLENLENLDRPFLSASNRDGEVKAIDFPQPGEVDRQKRERLAQYLRSSSWGKHRLAIAREIKQKLQIHDQMVIRLEEQQRTIRRRDLEMKVFVPFLRGLNREINRLFSETGIASQGIRQALCTGGSASLVAISRWLRQKLPSAAIIQDRTTREQPEKCSRVAYGLANLPLNSQVIDRSAHQYSSYFLLLELLRVMPDRPISEPAIFQLLEQRGINTKSCGDRLHQLLCGKLPPGFVPQPIDQIRLTPESWQTINALELKNGLCTQTDLGQYQLNPDSKKALLILFNRILESSQQTLQEPYLILEKF